MTIQAYIINKDWSFNLTDRATNRRISSQHGMIKLFLNQAYHAGSFDRAWDYIKDCGWNENYLKAELRAIFNDVLSSAYFINEDSVDYSKHTVARL
jgi:hypothetical protein